MTGRQQPATSADRTAAAGNVPALRRKGGIASNHLLPRNCDRRAERSAALGVCTDRPWWRPLASWCAASSLPERSMERFVVVELVIVETSPWARRARRCRARRTCRRHQGRPRIQVDSARHHGTGNTARVGAMHRARDARAGCMGMHVPGRSRSSRGCSRNSPTRPPLERHPPRTND